MRLNLLATCTAEDELSTQLIGVAAEHAADLTVATEPPPNENRTLGCAVNRYWGERCWGGRLLVVVKTKSH
jgi:hypothetical protein